MPNWQRKHRKNSASSRPRKAGCWGRRLITLSRRAGCPVQEVNGRRYRIKWTPSFKSPFSRFVLGFAWATLLNTTRIVIDRWLLSRSQLWRILKKNIRDYANKTISNWAACTLIQNRDNANQIFALNVKLVFHNINNTLSM